MEQVFLLSPVPGAPPQSVSAFAESSTSLRVVWSPPPEHKRNGLIVYYKIFYVPSKKSDSEAAEVEIKSPATTEYVVDKLLKWTDYRIWMLAGTVVGDGPKSSPIVARTDEDGKLLSFLKGQTDFMDEYILLGDTRYLLRILKYIFMKKC